MAKKKGIDQPPAPELTEIRDVVGRARQGDVSALPRLRELLTAHPALWQRYGDLAAQAEAAWVNLAAGPNLHLRECLLRQAAALRAELAGPSPAPVERLLAERVTACWLQLNYFDVAEAQSVEAGVKPRLAAYRAKRQEQAQRSYLAALAALTTLRKLLPAAAAPGAGRAKPNGQARKGRQRHEHSADLPPGGRNRLAGLFEDLYGSGTEGRHEALCSTGSED